jgi:hypothetical protein
MQGGDRGPDYASIAALNAAWGSNYDTFGSDAATHTDPCFLGAGCRPVRIGREPAALFHAAGGTGPVFVHEPVPLSPTVGLPSPPHC